MSGEDSRIPAGNPRIFDKHYTRYRSNRETVGLGEFFDGFKELDPRQLSFGGKLQFRCLLMNLRQNTISLNAILDCPMRSPQKSIQKSFHKS